MERVSSQVEEDGAGSGGDTSPSLSLSSSPNVRVAAVLVVCAPIANGWEDGGTASFSSCCLMYSTAELSMVR